ncbi:MAG: hypothetical protein R3D67_21170 [Hyphomicrobiaceae bacterium]
MGSSLPPTPAAPHISIVERYRDLPDLVGGLGKILAERIAEAKALGLGRFPGKPILVIVDEFAQIMLEPDSKSGREAITDGFVRLGNQARAANIVLWVQVQHAVAETLPRRSGATSPPPSAFASPRVRPRRTSSATRGISRSTSPGSPAASASSRHGLTSEITALQAANVGLADIPTLLKGNADASHP